MFCSHIRYYIFVVNLWFLTYINEIKNEKKYIYTFLIYYLFN